MSIFSTTLDSSAGYTTSFWDDAYRNVRTSRRVAIPPEAELLISQAKTCSLRSAQTLLHQMMPHEEYREFWKNIKKRRTGGWYFYGDLTVSVDRNHRGMLRFTVKYRSEPVLEIAGTTLRNGWVRTLVIMKALELAGADVHHA